MERPKAPLDVWIEPWKPRLRPVSLSTFFKLMGLTLLLTVIAAIIYQFFPSPIAYWVLLAVTLPIPVFLAANMLIVVVTGLNGLFHAAYSAFLKAVWFSLTVRLANKRADDLEAYVSGGSQGDAPQPYHPLDFMQYQKKMDLSKTFWMSWACLIPFILAVGYAAMNPMFDSTFICFIGLFLFLYFLVFATACYHGANAKYTDECRELRKRTFGSSSTRNSLPSQPQKA